MLHYIDPGTGSMLFTILVGVLSAGIYGLKNIGLKLKFALSGGKAKNDRDAERIPFVVVTDDKRYWTMFRPICKEFENRGERMVYMTASEDDPAIEDTRRWGFVKAIYTGEGNKSYAAWNRIKADVVLSTTPSLDVFQWKRSPDAKWYIHIPHAASDITLYRMFGIDYFDAILLTGEFQAKQIRELEAKRGLPEKELEIVGFPTFDEMSKRYDAVQKEQRKVAQRIQAGRKKTVLLAPSWGKSSIWGKYGDRVLKKLIETDYDIIVRPHPQSWTSEKAMMEDLTKRYPESTRLHWDRKPDNFSSLNRADILISDFSGVLFDFTMVFDKPIIYADTEFNSAPYDACWLDEDLWTFTVLPHIGKQLTEESLERLGEVIDESLHSKSDSDRRQFVRESCWAYRGEGAKRIADYMIKKRKELSEIAEQ